MKIKSTLFFLVILILLIIVITSGIYYVNFKSHKISDNPENWSQFADYFGSIINTFLSIINLVILTYLTLKIVDVEDMRNKWTLQELARPYGNLSFDSDIDSLEISLNNCGLGPMIIKKITILKKSELNHSNFFSVIESFNHKTDINAKVSTFHTNETNTAIAKDQSISLLKIVHNNEEDELNDFTNFSKKCISYLNEFRIKIEYEDMYNRKMPIIDERIDFVSFD